MKAKKEPFFNSNAYITTIYMQKYEEKDKVMACRKACEELKQINQVYG